MTCDDFKAMVRQMFEVADENKDNILELDEFKQFSLFMLEALDGLSLSQSTEELDSLFARFDANKDGKLDWKEIWTACLPIEAKILAKSYSWKATKDMSPEKFKAMVRQMFEVADENHDSVLVTDEFKQFTLYVLEGMQGLQLANSAEEMT